MFKLPFGYLPGHWGLRGHIREEAKILYEIEDPYDQEIALAKLRFKNDRPQKLEILEIDYKYGKIANEYEYELAKISISFEDEKIQKIKKAELDLKFNKLSETEYEKEISNLNNQPWVGIKNSNYDPKNGLGGLAFELDWNEQFIIFLSENGYKGLSDQLVVEAWFNDLCKSVIAEEGMDNYVEAMETGANNSLLPLINRKDIDGDRSEFS